MPLYIRNKVSIANIYRKKKKAQSLDTLLVYFICCKILKSETIQTQRNNKYK